MKYLLSDWNKHQVKWTALHLTQEGIVIPPKLNGDHGCLSFHCIATSYYYFKLKLNSANFATGIKADKPQTKASFKTGNSGIKLMAEELKCG